MIHALTEQLSTALAAFSSTTRLVELTIADADNSLLVEAFAARDAVDEVGARDVIALSTNAYVDPATLLGQPASLALSLADGSRASFSGEISEAAMLGSDGGFARYRIRISPWLWRLGQVRNSRVWQDKSVIDIVDAVFEAWLPLARWRWSDDVRPFMAETLPRSYCCQYRESDLDFVRRLLAGEGLSWRFEQTEDGPVLVLFADSTQPCAAPEDASSARNGGTRFHGVSAVEASDTVQALRAHRSLHASLLTVLSGDYKAKRSIAESAPSYLRYGRGLPEIEAYEVPGQYAWASRALARRDADLRMQAREARGQLWQGRSTVRTLCAGTSMIVTGTPLGTLGDAAAFTVLRVTSVGVNNLPPPATHALAELFGPIPELLDELTRAQVSADMAPVIERALKSGYANAFDAVPADVPWRPALLLEDEETVRKPSAFGAQSAIVVGADGSDTPNGADELYCDRLGRVRIRFHWQESGDATCWVRVAQRLAGGGMGTQFLPRIGQEVLVQFIENDIDRPLIVGALYNGRGEGGVAPTPGGVVSSSSDLSCFAFAQDRRASGQGNLAGGHSPVWHGASVDSAGHRNAAAQWGIRSKEFGGYGYNQLLFDDTDGQGRVQLRCTSAASELSLGHLIHAADNYRGSFRGLGAELRTDDYGAVRAGGGLLVSSYGVGHSASARDPAGENAAGVGLLQQAVALAGSFNMAAVTHRTVGLAAHLGSMMANASVLDEKAGPLAAMSESASGQADIAGAAGKLPYPRDPVIAISAKDGFGANAGQSLQLANGETVSVMSGQDSQFVTGGAMRVHSGQAIGVLGGAVKAGESGVGLQMIAAREAIDVQAQGDELTVQARDAVDVISANAHIDWAAARRISLSTAGGANITIEGGGITVQCPGKITINAGKKNFSASAQMNYKLPIFPQSVCVECLAKRALQRSAFINKGA
ncbi:Actin cross-linking toxin VgrG1 [Massilia sp. Bi118]|uniref:type VI secretion system Vgr family protein n=1 Tax=Massilia sp. Bi118 TaxID=2822346 RepID=UPI001D26E767|nr:type VI secretion system Vgr family protein [Massilia sp. Bi118]CAH0285147.1 Actin cross-linking toxin VgrG1 [Massilia sp. Bi118]